MPVELDAVRGVEVPTRIVHGPGALARVGETLSELGVTRPMLVTEPGVAAAADPGAGCARLHDELADGPGRGHPRGRMKKESFKVDLSAKKLLGET